MQSVVAQVQARLHGLPVAVGLVLPDGQRIDTSGAQLRLMFKHWASLARLASGQIGLVAQDYVEGKVEIDGSVRELMTVAASVLPGNPAHIDMPWWSRVVRSARSRVAHTKARDAAQVQFHYDVSDDFYALWLDPKRVYSCAYYRDDTMSLTQAQEAKLDHICRKLMLRSGERFLDIGAGWGGLLLWAAEHYGVQATGITLSKNQHAHVNRLIEAKGLQGRVRMELRDYRELDEAQRFDKIASIGMFEHVGSAHMTAYCQKQARLLEPGGLTLNHGITAGGTHNAQLGAGMGDFIEKYIFPGGELQHISAVVQHMADGALEMLDTENLRPHYARTLWAWSDALEAQLDVARKVLSQSAGAGRAESILRAYRLYLAGSAMCFEHGWIALHQVLAAHAESDAMHNPPVSYPFNREYMYLGHSKERNTIQTV
jgi:cyclopropane-fatty-acyl-phospholipid synthase